MIKFILQLILVVAFGYVSHWLLPWWGVMAGAALATIIIYTKAVLSFISGMLGVGGLWFTVAFTINEANNSLLSNGVAELFDLSTGMQMVLVTAFLGGLVGGLSGLTGNCFRALFKKTKKNYSPYH